MGKKIALFLMLSWGCFAALPSYPNFYDNPLLDEKMRTLMAPYLLPVDHPIKPRLDEIFSQSRVCQNKKTLLDAGFVIIAEQPISLVIVAQHPEVPGYLFKLNLDSEHRQKKNDPHWLWFTRRCSGARKIKELIKKNEIKHFTVPDKWLYVIPRYPLSPEPQSQPVIVVETYFELAENSPKAWKTRIKPRHLDELYTILKHGYGSVHVGHNVPYTKGKKFAFIDTEGPKRALNLKAVRKYLSDDMRLYWDELVNN